MAPTAPTDLYHVFDGQEALLMAYKYIISSGNNSYLTIFMQVKIGQNTLMTLEKREHIMRNTSDGKFCLELARHFWRTAEVPLQLSLTSQAWRSQSTGIMKLQVTPENVEMIKVLAFFGVPEAVFGSKQPEKPEDVRVEAARRYLHGFFTEVGRQGKRIRNTTKE
ncbi:hypothetical protein MRX96_000050 [Rhipicephalus microplus]